MGNRQLTLGVIAVDGVMYAAFLRFCVIQKVSEDKIVLTYEPSSVPHYQMGIVAQEEDMAHIVNVLNCLDEFEIPYETNFEDLPNR